MSKRKEFIVNHVLAFQSVRIAWKVFALFLCQWHLSFGSPIRFCFFFFSNWEKKRTHDVAFASFCFCPTAITAKQYNSNNQRITMLFKTLAQVWLSEHLSFSLVFIRWLSLAVIPFHRIWWAFHYISFVRLFGARVQARLALI